MPFRGEPADLLKHILPDISKIELFTEDVDEASFGRKPETAYAVQYALLRISEAAYRLGDRAAELSPEIQWRDIRGLGNRLRHAYDTVDNRLIWRIVEKDLPLLKTAVQCALDAIE